MSQVKERIRCPSCAASGGDTSEDNLVMYEDGHGHCHACGYHVYAGGGYSKDDSLTDTPKTGNYLIPYPTALTMKGLPKRGISKDTCDKAGVFSVLHDSGSRSAITGFPLYDAENTLQAVKYRNWSKPKDDGIWVEGNREFALGGLQNINGRTTTILICEGEPDYLSWFQTLQHLQDVAVIYMSGGKGGVKTIKANLTYLLNFDIILSCDQDTPGLATLEELKRLFPPVRTKTITYPGLGSKDANSILMESGEDELLELFGKATAIMPNEITFGDELVDSSLSLFLDDNQRIGPSTGYPSLDKIIGGYAPGKLIMLAGDTGDGKSTVVSNLCYNAIKGGIKPFVVPLEMSADQMLLALAGIELGVNLLGDPNAKQLVSPEEYRRVAVPLSKQATWATHFGLLDMDEFSNMTATAVNVFRSKLIILDHITAATVGNDWQTMEKYAYRLKELALQHNVCMFVISHITVKNNNNGVEDKDLDIRKKRLTKDSLRGSRAFSQVPDVVIGIERKDPYCILYPVKQDRFVNVKEDCILKWNIGRLTEHNGKLQKQGRKTLPSDAPKFGVRTKDLQDNQQPEGIPSSTGGVKEREMPSTGGESDKPSTKGDGDSVHPGLASTTTEQVLRDQGSSNTPRHKKTQSGVSAVRDKFSTNSIHSARGSDS